MLFYRAALPLSSQTLDYTAGVIRRHRRKIGSPWRKLAPGRQALLVLAYLRKGQTFAELAAGFGVGSATAWRYVSETVALLAARSPKLRRALADAGKAGHAYVVIDGEVRISIDAPAAPTGRIELAKLGPGASVGEIAILCDVPRTATVTATGKTVTLRISKELFFRLITEFPQIAVEVMRELAHRLENTNLQLREARAVKPH